MPTNLYAIRTFGASFVKVGIAHSPEKRLSDLQVGNPFPLFIQAVRPKIHESNEMDFHRQFRGYRVSGEWFEWRSDVIIEIQSWEGYQPDSEQILRQKIANKKENLFIQMEDQLRQQNIEHQNSMSAFRNFIRETRIMLKALDRCLGVSGESTQFNHENTKTFIDSLSHEKLASMLFEFKNDATKLSRFAKSILDKTLETLPYDMRERLITYKSDWREADRLWERIKENDHE